jgi:RimJ/RimL family protein N-acetyltransferase
VDVSLQIPGAGAVEIRPIRTDDSQRLQASHAHLSADTVYRRYLAHKPQLSSSDVRHLVDVDGCDHFALVATLGEEIIAVARFIRIKGDPEAAEFAIVVRDAHQRHGLATALMRRLAQAAAERGVTRFVATILSDNVGIRRLMNKVAAGPLRERRQGSVSEVEFDLAPAPAMIAGCAGS